MKHKNFQTQKNPFSKNAEGIGEINYEVLLLMKVLQSKPQVENMNVNYFDLYYTVIKTRDENKYKNDQYENHDKDYINLNDIIIPNQYIGTKSREY